MLRQPRQAGRSLTANATAEVRAAEGRGDRRCG
jgi:hypothetical protein